MTACASPPTRRIATAAAILAIAVSAASGAREPQTLLGDLRACMLEQDDVRRLSCYDEMASAYQPAAAKPAGPAAAAPVTAVPVAAAKAQPPAAPVAAQAPVAAAGVEPKVAAAVKPEVAAADAEGRFGFRGDLARAELDRQQAAASKLERLTAAVAKIARLPRGELVVTLDNGQVWRQKRRDPHSRLKVGDQVTIRAGSLGSFWMSGPSGRATSVNRVQ